MACSPKRPDPLRDAEARVRALTREVGTLREDLRREVKRRERAVAQAKEHEEARRESEGRCQELSYSNRKLASELESLHETARAGQERDRRALRGLREGLAAVESAVAARARRGYAHVRQLQTAHQQLRALLLGLASSCSPHAAAGSSSLAAAAAAGFPGGAVDASLLANVTVLSSVAAPRVEQLLGAAQAHAARLAELLAGGEG
ncbi:hypothetical protein Agub_g8634, partial [Astrephomene gubernaculifera]